MYLSNEFYMLLLLFTFSRDPSLKNVIKTKHTSTCYIEGIKKKIYKMIFKIFLQYEKDI